jgi:hypothetical protein
MALPQIDVQTFDINISSLGKKFKFRPFLVKEEKLLVMAGESEDKSDMVRAVQQIITNCSMGKVDGDNLPIFDLQKVFLEIRGMSVSNIINLVANCGECGIENDVVFDLEKVKITKNKGHTNKIKLTETMTLEMNYPEVREISKLMGSEIEEIYNVTANCIRTIYNDEEVIDFQESPLEERIDFIEGFSVKQFALIRQFYESMPQILHGIDFKCKACKKDNTLVIDGYENFFV